MSFRRRAEDMASMNGYSGLLQSCGHFAEIFTCSCIEMKMKRMKAAEFIFNKCKKDGFVEKDEVFDGSVVDISDIDDGTTYYAVFLIIPSIAEHFCSHGRMTASSDASHFQGIWPQSYGTIFEVVIYDANNHIIPVLFYYLVGTECDETWSKVFK